MNIEDISQYLGKRTIFIGRLNCGKTRKTANILKAFTESGLSRQVTVLDLAPETIAGAGGKLACPKGDMIYLTAPITAPRLRASSNKEAQILARFNVRIIEPLLTRAFELNRPILVINDATLYLQAASGDRLIDLIGRSQTVIANAYWGNDFPESDLTARERRRTRRLLRVFDTVVEGPAL